MKQANADRLTDALRADGSLTSGRVIGVEVVATSTTGTSRSARLTPKYSGDASGRVPANLFLKLSGPPGAGSLPKDILLGEARFYASVPASMPDPPLVRCYEVGLDEKTGRSHVLLEDLSETHKPLGTPPTASMEDYCKAMESLAGFHAFWWEHPSLGAEISKLPTRTHAADYLSSVQEHLPGYLDCLGDRLPHDWRGVYERVMRSFEPLYTQLTRPGHRTLINGDPHPRNILLAVDPAERRARIIDWQFYNVSAATHDLRLTIALPWPAEQRRLMEEAVLRHYHRALVAQGVKGYSWDDCWQGYRISAIDNLFMPMWQWTIGAAPDSLWQVLKSAMAAFDDLDCEEMLT